MRGWMNEGRSYIAPVGIGKVMRAGAVGRVIVSKHTGFAVGDHVYGRFGVQEYAPSKGDGVTKVDPIQAPLPVFLGTLGFLRRSSSSSRVRTSVSSCCRSPTFEGQAESRQTFS
jgi:NADPH-dependent curcumin reductase CurA